MIFGKVLYDHYETPVFRSMIKKKCIACIPPADAPMAMMYGSLLLFDGLADNGI
ncbi:MAG: hypothetical protein IPI60_18180 [Saprospiraceae bacterium]|nr:hypothetical protein [Saprospiraceae bacterium]